MNAPAKPLRDPLATLAALLLAAATIAVPLAGLGLLPGAALSPYAANLVGQTMCFAVLAMSVDLMWGGAGVLSLGHGLFFALGGYLCAMHLLRTAWHATGTLPDFLLFMGQGGFPAWWGFADSWILTLAAIVAVPALAAFAFGYVSFRSRVNGVYFSIISQALVYTAMLLMFRNDTGFGGNNGMTGFRTVAGLASGGRGATILLATLSCAAALATLLGGRALLATRFGRLLAAIRDDEPRLRFLGYQTLWLKLAAWCLSASLAGVAGALYVPQVGIVNPSLLDPSLSLEVAVWVAVGGRGGLYGALAGAILVNLLRLWLSASAPVLLPFVLGLLVLAVVLALPNGLLDLRNRSRAWLAALGAAPALLRRPGP